MGSAWNALADPTRRKILQLLKSGDMNAGEIAAHFECTKPTISHHLEKLRSAGLVSSEKQGQMLIYSLNTTVFQEMMAFFAQLAHEGEETR